MEPVPPLTAGAASDLIILEHVTKTFSAVRAVDDLSLRIHAGEIFGLIGPNGSGKTTLIRLLLGLLRPSSGSVRVLGQRMPNWRAASSIGYMTQASALYGELSVRENLAFFGSLYGLRGHVLDTRIQEVVELVDLTERVRSPIQTLSGGMRQRVSLACALVHQPRLLFLDEPTVGIDPNISAALSYFWIIGLIFFLIEKQNRFVRFHALQGLFYGVGFAIVATILDILSSHVFFLLGCLGGLLWVAWVVGAVYAAVQAYNGKWFKLPVVGDMAYNNATSWTPGA